MVLFLACYSFELVRLIWDLLVLVLGYIFFGKSTCMGDCTITSIDNISSSSSENGMIPIAGALGQSPLASDRVLNLDSVGVTYWFLGEEAADSAIVGFTVLGLSLF